MNLIAGLLAAVLLVAQTGLIDERALRAPTPRPVVREELAIIEAALADPWLIKETDGGRFAVNTQTWPDKLAIFDFDTAHHELSLREGNDLVVVPGDVLDPYRDHNRFSMSLKGLKMPAQTQHSPKRTGYAAYWSHVSVSRPGISQDGTKALVTVTPDMHGYVAYLELRDGTWRLITTGLAYDI